LNPKLLNISGGFSGAFQSNWVSFVRQFFKKTSFFQVPVISKKIFPSLSQTVPTI